MISQLQKPLDIFAPICYLNLNTKRSVSFLIFVYLPLLCVGFR